MKIAKAAPFVLSIVVVFYFVMAFVIGEKAGYIWGRLKDCWPYVVASFGVLETWVGLNKLKEKKNG